MADITVNVGEELFLLESKEDWEKNAPATFRRHRVTPDDVICVDTAGRIVMGGKEFRRAHKESTYPVRVYRVEPLK